jgi:hypothetical protein
MGGQRHTPAPLPLEKRPGIHCTGGWVGTMTGQETGAENRDPLPGLDPRTVQPVASRYTD